MKNIITLSFLLLFTVGIYAQQDVKFYMSSGEIKSIAIERIDSLTFDNSEEYIYVTIGNRVEPLEIASIDSICYGELSSNVKVEYNNTKVLVENPYAFDSVAVSIDGAHVTVNSSTNRQIEYRLSGSSENGSFKLYGEKKYIISLSGLSLTSDCGAAINSQCSKRGKVVLESGTINSLKDATEYSSLLPEDEKGTLFSEGQLVFEGDGKLSVVSKYKHAICSDDYIEIRGGDITVPSALADAIHANDSIIVMGGNIALSATKDGIDCDGNVRLAGGTVEINLASNDVKGVKSGKDICLEGTNLIIKMSGNIAKGLKSVGATNILDGNIDISLSGNSMLVDNDPSYATAIKSDSCVNISGGVVQITTTGIAGRGISADKDINITDGNCNIMCSGDNEIYEPDETDSNDEEIVESYKLYVAKPSSSNTGGFPGGMGGGSSTWSSIYLYDSSNTLIATLTNYITINGTQFYYYDFGTPVTGNYYFMSNNSWNRTIKSETFSGLSTDTYYQISSTYTSSGNTRTYSITDVTSNYANGVVSSGSATEKSFEAVGIKSDADFTLSGGNHKIEMSGTASKGVKSDMDCYITGGTLVIETSGNAAVVAADPSYCSAIKSNRNFEMSAGNLSIKALGVGGMGLSVDGTLNVMNGNIEINVFGNGSSYTSVSGTDYYSTKCIKSDVAMNLYGGTIACKTTGNGGKGIVSDGLLTIGDGDRELKLDVRTSGNALGTSSSGNMGGMGGGMSEGFNGAPKAIKGKSNVVINTGDIYVQTSADGGEGIESKATLTINGGSIECATYDDAINAATNLTINGGYIYCYASKNDGIDSNGTININGGVVLSSGTSQPEEGFDCDNNSFTITGGILIGTGGATSSPTSATQYYSSLSSVTLTSGSYLSVKDSSGNLLFSYLCPNSLSGATVLLSSPSFTNSSYTLMYGVTSVSNAIENHFDNVFLVGGTATGGGSKSFTPTKR